MSLDSSIRDCDLSEYREILGVTERPSSEQIDNFVGFFAEAHSWYKHIPMTPPGRTFMFLVDPFAGMERVRDGSGPERYRERTTPPEFRHYTWMTTSEYRSRFGSVSYLPLRAGTRPAIDSPSGPVRVPAEIVEAASTCVTGVIHPGAVAIPNTLPEFLEGKDWPEETGGAETLRRILELGAEWRATRRDVGDEMHALMKPERLRLRGLVRQALQRSVALTFGDMQSTGG